MAHRIIPARPRSHRRPGEAANARVPARRRGGRLTSIGERSADKRLQPAPTPAAFPTGGPEVSSLARARVWAEAPAWEVRRGFAETIGG
jgi:hypothetical protein